MKRRVASMGFERCPALEDQVSGGLGIEDQVSGGLGSEVAILNLKGGTYYGLDDAGARIWSLLQEPRIVEEIRDVLLREYEVEPDRCERGLLALLQRLADEKLVEVGDGTFA